jgi:hypothetical protein
MMGGDDGGDEGGVGGVEGGDGGAGGGTGGRMGGGVGGGEGGAGGEGGEGGAGGSEGGGGALGCVTSSHTRTSASISQRAWPVCLTVTWLPCTPPQKLTNGPAEIAEPSEVWQRVALGLVSPNEPPTHTS